MVFKRDDIKPGSDASTTKIVLIVFSVFIMFILTTHLVAAWHINRHERNMHPNLEAQPLLQDGSHDADILEDADIRRMLKRFWARDQIRDHISGVYEMSMTRIYDNVSSKDSDSDVEVVEGVQCKCQGEPEADNESSESGYESSDDSDGDSNEVMQMRRLLSMTRPVSKRDAMLRTKVRKVRD